MYQWQQASFDTVTDEGPCRIEGFVYKGLGLELVMSEDGNGYCEDWDVTHLASGRRIGAIIGLDEEEMFKIAAMIADLIDWSAVNTASEAVGKDPELVTKLLALSELSGGSLLITAGPVEH